MAAVCMGSLFLCQTVLADPIKLDPQASPDKFRGIQTTGVIRPVASYTWSAAPWTTTTKPLGDLAPQKRSS